MGFTISKIRAAEVGGRVDLERMRRRLDSYKGYVKRLEKLREMTNVVWVGGAEEADTAERIRAACTERGIQALVAELDGGVGVMVPAMSQHERAEEVADQIDPAV